MIKNINGVFWFCCPKCDKKLLQAFPGAVSRGIYVRCPRCAWMGEINIKETETRWQVSENYRASSETVTK